MLDCLVFGQGCYQVIGFVILSQDLNQELSPIR